MKPIRLIGIILVLALLLVAIPLSALGESGEDEDEGYSESEGADEDDENDGDDEDDEDGSEEPDEDEEPDPDEDDEDDDEETTEPDEDNGGGEGSGGGSSGGGGSDGAGGSGGGSAGGGGSGGGSSGGGDTSEPEYPGINVDPNPDPDPDLDPDPDPDPDGSAGAGTDGGEDPDGSAGGAENEGETEAEIPEEEPEEDPALLSPAAAPVVGVADFDQDFQLTAGIGNQSVVSGATHSLQIYYNYTAGTTANIPGLSDMVEMVVRFPSELTGISMQASNIFEYSEENLENGDTEVTLKFLDLEAGSGNSTVLFFKSQNGVTPHDEEITIDLEIIFGGETSTTHSQELAFRPATTVFGWNNVRSTADNVAVATDTLEAIRDIKFTYSATNPNANTDSGLAYTEKVVITDVIQVNEPVLLKASELSGNLAFVAPNGGSGRLVSYETRADGVHVDQFTIEFTVPNAGLPGKDLASFTNTCSVTIGGARLEVADPAVATSGRLTGTPSMKAYAYVAVDNTGVVQEGGAYVQTHTGAAHSATLTYTAPVIPDGEKSDDSARIIPVKTASPATVYPGGAVTFRLSNFKNAQSRNMNSFTVVDSGYDLTQMYPAYLTTGKYTWTSGGTLPENYTIELYLTGSTTPDHILTARYDTSQTIMLSEHLEPMDIEKIAFCYGAVPPGFAPSTVPAIQFYVMEEASAKLTNTMTLSYQYLFEGELKEHSVSADGSANLNPKPIPDQDEERKENKEMENLTRPGSSVILPGDLLKFTVTYTNTNTGRTWYNPEIEDRYTNLAPYIDGVVQTEAGFSGQNLKIVSGTTGNIEGFRSPAWEIKNPGTADEFLIIYLKGMLEPQDKLVVSYVMQVVDDPADSQRVKNVFSVYGYPKGSGSARVYLGGGYYQKGHAKGEIPAISVTQQVTHTDTDNTAYNPTVDIMRMGDRLRVSVLVENTSTSAVATPVNLRNIVSYISYGTNLDAYAVVDGSASVSYRSQTYSVDAVANYAVLSGYRTWYFQLRGSDPNTGLNLEPGDKAILTYDVEVTDWINNTAENTVSASQTLLSRAFFVEARDKYTSTPLSPWDDGTSGGADKDAATRSYVPTQTNSLTAQRNPATLYGGMTISGPANNNALSLNSTLPTRTYTFTIHNYSTGATQQMELGDIVAQLPAYEEFYPEGGATISYSGGTAYAIGAETTQVLTDAGGRPQRIIRFTGLRDSGGAAIGSQPVVIPGGGTETVTISFQTTVREDLQTALRDAAQISSTFVPAFYSAQTISATTKNQVYRVADTGDWDGDSSTTERYQYPQRTLLLQNSYVVPGVGIAPRKVVLSGGVRQFQDATIDDALSLTDQLGWRVTVYNGSGSSPTSTTMTRPLVIVQLPYGMKAPEVSGFADPSIIHDNQYAVTTVGDLQYMTFVLDRNIARGGNFGFDFTVDASGSYYGELPANAWVVPRELCYPTSMANKSDYVTINPAVLTGATQSVLSDFEGLDESRGAARSSGKMPLYGMFKFRSSISVTGEGGSGATKTTPDTLVVARQVNDQLLYTLTVTNGSSDITYEDVVIINRLPGVDDLYNINTVARGSTMNLRLAELPDVRLSSGSVIATPYFTRASRDTVFTRGDYNLSGQAAATTWDKVMDGATAFKLEIDSIPPSTTLTVTYRVALPDPLPDRDAFAYNSFGFAFLADTNMAAPGGGTSIAEIRSEPYPVGLAMPDVPSGTVKGLLFVDTNHDGEYGSEDILYTDDLPVQLLDAGTAQIVASTTAQGGFYEFQYVREGDYRLHLPTVPGGYLITVKGTGAAANRFDAVGNTQTFTVEDGQTYTFNGGFYLINGLVDVTIFVDTNGDGHYNADEDQLYTQPIAVSLLQDNEGYASSTTSTGQQQFHALPYGYYELQILIPEGYELSGTDFTAQDAVARTGLFGVSASAPSHSKYLGLIKPAGPVDPPIDPPVPPPAKDDGTVEGLLFVDANENYEYDNAEALLLQRVDVLLLDAATGEQIASQQVVSGQYRFTGLAYGDYTVRVSKPSGYAITGGIGSGEQGNKFGTDYVTQAFRISDTDKTHRKNAGFVAVSVSSPTGTVTGGAFVDHNRNGVLDAGEPMLANLVVTLYDRNNVRAATTRTDSHGLYAFDRVQPGDYYVLIAGPSGATVTPVVGSGATDNKLQPDNRSAIFTVEADNRYSVYGGFFVSGGGSGGGGGGGSGGGGGTDKPDDDGRHVFDPSGPEGLDDTITIDDGPIPLGNLPGNVVTIYDEGVPLGRLPTTGSRAGSALGLAGLLLMIAGVCTPRVRR